MEDLYYFVSAVNIVREMILYKMSLNLYEIFNGKCTYQLSYVYLYNILCLEVLMPLTMKI